eukprot:m51a1_g10701 hypothetical protein (425) ;mRNA; r:156319-157844
MRFLAAAVLLLLVPSTQVYLSFFVAAPPADHSQQSVANDARQQPPETISAAAPETAPQPPQQPPQQQQQPRALREPAGRVECKDIDAVYTWVDRQASPAPRPAVAGEPVVARPVVARHGVEREPVVARHGVAERVLRGATSASRTRDMGTLQYSLRALESNAPWVRRLFLVTDGQVPAWLNTSRVTVVPHASIFVEEGDEGGSRGSGNGSAVGLPTANSNAIEANLHRIAGLSQCFLYLNDDVFVWKPIQRSFFVSPDSRPVFHQGRQKAPSFPGVFTPSWHTQLHYTNEVLGTRYGHKPRNYPSHSCYLWSRWISERAWVQWPEEMRLTVSHKLRLTTDMVMSMVQLHVGLAENATVLGNASLHTVEWGDKVSENTLALEKALKQDPDCLCFQDGSATKPEALKQLISVVAEAFPHKSAWEIN